MPRMQRLPRYPAKGQLLMRNFRHLVSAASAAVFFTCSPAAHAETAEQFFNQLQAKTLQAEKQRLVLDVDLQSSPGFSEESGPQGEVLVRYRMGFNNVAEGWNWHPEANPNDEDYYRAKFLPLQSVTEERNHYTQEDKIGSNQDTGVTWRYDYFLSFENLYDFYQRSVDDDAGFGASLPKDSAGHIRMQAIASLVDPYTSQSTTFWKAMYSRPVDFTLKKRYLHGKLEEVRFLDDRDSRILAVIKPIK